MIWGILGAAVAIVSVASAGYSIYDILSTGAYKNWSIGDWCWNICYLLLMITPFFDVFGGFVKTITLIAGGIGKLLMKVPLLGTLVSVAHSIYLGLKTAWEVWGLKLFAKGGWLYQFGKGVASLGRAIVKHPWLMFGLIFSTTMFDGILKRIYQLWGDLTLRAMNFMYERVASIMSDNGYGDPVSQAVGILNQSQGSLPPCFTAIWGAVGASECIGLIIATFQYLFLLAALVKGYKVYGK